MCENRRQQHVASSTLFNECPRRKHAELDFYFRARSHGGDGLDLSDVPVLSRPGKITLRDLKRCKMSHIFFDTFFNIEKYLDHEQRDPFFAVRVRVPSPPVPGGGSVEQTCANVSSDPSKEAETDGQQVSDWEKYAAEEYNILAAEEAIDDPCIDV